MDKLKKFHVVQIKGVNEQDFTVDVTVSSKSVDRDGDIILPEAFKKHIKYYKAHPVLMSDHSYSIMKQIGEAKKINITDDGLDIKFKYYVGEGNAEADWAFILAQKKMAAYSIGFMPKDWEWMTEKDDEGHERYTGRKFKEIELLEISHVAIPSNRDAIQEEMHRSDIAKELAGMVMKGIDSGEIILPEIKKVNKNNDSHYSDVILGDGTAKEQTIEHLPKLDDVNKAVRDSIKEALK